MTTCLSNRNPVRAFPICFLVALTSSVPIIAEAQTINVSSGGTETISVDTTVDDINFTGDGTINGTGALIGAGSTIEVDVTGAANTGTIDNVINDSASAMTDTSLRINDGSGTGTVVLDRANTYVGGTVISAGSLTAGNENALGTGAVTMANGTLLGFDLNPNRTVSNDISIAGTVGLASTANSVTLTGDISGAGGIEIIGPGGVSFQGTNTFTGGIDVQQGFITLDALSGGSGTITLTDGTAAGLSGGSVANNFVINGDTNIFQSGGSATLNGVISGTGNYQKGGDGTINLTNNHTFTGSLNILAGSINLNGTSSLMTSEITASSFTIIRLRTDGGAFLSTPSLSLESKAFNLDTIFEITGDETIGAFSASDIQPMGTGMVDVNISGAATTLTFGDATNTTFDGLIRGNGNLLKQGSGTFSLLQASTLSGMVTVNDGIFDLMGDGALSSATINVNGGELQTDGGGLAAGSTISVGNGGIFDINGDETIDQLINLGTVDLADGQTLTANTLTQNGGLFLANGNFFGTTTVNGGKLGGDGTLNGAVIINAGGTFAPGNSIGTTTVIGNASFNSGSTYEVEVNANGTSDLIQVTGSTTISGGTVSVLPEPGNYDNQTTYTILTSAGGVAGAFAQSTIGNSFAFLSPSLRYDPNTVFLDLIRNAQTFSSVGQTFNQRQVGIALDSDQAAATGELRSAIDNILVQSGEEARRSLDNLSGEIHSAGINASFLGLQTAVSTIRERRSLFSPSTIIDSSDAKAVIPSGEGKSLVIDDSNSNAAWIQTYGTLGEIDKDGNGSEIDHWSGGILLGADYSISNQSILGFSVGSFSTRADILSQEYEADGVIGAITVHHEADSGFNFQVTGGFAYQDIETERRLSVGAFSSNAKADYDALSGFVSGKTYLEHCRENVTFQPFLGVDAIFTESDGFRETGAGTAGLISNGESYSSVIGRIGVEFAGQTETQSGLVVGHAFSLAYAHEFGDATPDTSFSFVGGSSAFVSAASARGEDRFEAKASIATKLNDRADLIGTAEAILTDSDAAAAGSLQIRIEF